MMTATTEPESTAKTCLGGGGPYLLDSRANNRFILGQKLAPRRNLEAGSQGNDGSLKGDIGRRRDHHGTRGGDAGLGRAR